MTGRGGFRDDLERRLLDRCEHCLHATRHDRSTWCLLLRFPIESPRTSACEHLLTPEGTPRAREG